MCDYHCDIILESEGEKILKSYPTVTTFVYLKSNNWQRCIEGCRKCACVSYRGRILQHERSDD